jgi:hypothetical protein
MLRPDDGSSKLLRNVGIILPDYTVQHPRRQSSSLATLLSWYRLCNELLPCPIRPTACLKDGFISELILFYTEVLAGQSVMCLRFEWVPLELQSGASLLAGPDLTNRHRQPGVQKLIREWLGAAQANTAGLCWWAVTPCEHAAFIFSPKDRGIMFLWNVCTCN